jgi:AraC-like DNA-binding protein
MVRIVILLAPVFMSLFWAATLMSDNKGHHLSRRYLSVFMLVPAFLMFCHFLYFANFPDWYVYFDLPLQLFGMMVFPLYHIYFRLLTVDDKISVKRQIKYLILPLAVVFVYGIAVFNSTLPEYKAWLFNKIDNPVSPSVQFLQIMRTVVKMTFYILVILYTTANHRLINRYSDRAEQFYSNVRDAKTNYAKMLNLSTLATGIVNLIVVAVGRAFLMSQDFLIFFAWFTITVTLFFIGSLGARQKVINPDVEKGNNDEAVQLFDTSMNEQEVLVKKILSEFRENKLYLNSELTIQDVAKMVGSNRTCMSGIINQKFNQNFCAFVNGFRVKELERIMLESPDYVLDQYVMLCGFGSVNSMKRSVAASTGMSLGEFRAALLVKRRA